MVIDLTFLNHTELRPDCNSHIIQRPDDTPLSEYEACMSLRFQHCRYFLTLASRPQYTALITSKTALGASQLIVSLWQRNKRHCSASNTSGDVAAIMVLIAFGNKSPTRTRKALWLDICRRLDGCYPRLTLRHREDPEKPHNKLQRLEQGK